MDNEQPDNHSEGTSEGPDYHSEEMSNESSNKEEAEPAKRKTTPMSKLPKFRKRTTSDSSKSKDRNELRKTKAGTSTKRMADAIKEEDEDVIILDAIDKEKPVNDSIDKERPVNDSIDKERPVQKKRKSSLKSKPNFVQSVNYDDGDVIKGEISAEQMNAITSYIKGEMLDVYKEIMGKPPLNGDPRNILIRKDFTFKKLRNAVFKRMKKMSSGTNIEEPQWRSWIYSRFYDVQSARKTLMDMYFKSNAKKEGNMTRQKMVKLFDGIKIGYANRKYGTNSNYEAFRRSLDQAGIYFPIIAVIEFYRSDDDAKYDKIMTYFGFENIVKLTNAKFWKNFKTIDRLIKYIDEAPDTIGPYDDDVPLEQQTANVKDELLVTLMKVQTDELIHYFGYKEDKNRKMCPENFGLGDYLQELRGLVGHKSNMEVTRRFVTNTRAPYCQRAGSDNSKFFKWLDDMVNIQSDSTMKNEPAEYFKQSHDTFALNVREISRLSDFVNKYPITCDVTMRKNIRNAWEWEKSPESAGASESQPRRNNISVNKVETKTNQRGVKRDHDSVTKDLCDLCAQNTKNEDSKLIHHKWQQCPLIWYFGFRKLDNFKNWGSEVTKMIEDDTFLQSINDQRKKTIEKLKIKRQKKKSSEKQADKPSEE
ncbi:hypothetical protein CJU90_1920 [Yarrowia sp. C11]|nr:hypothetical protein CKK34_5948 [Yarrowia sp. E02]KAG5371853.1 hypothetical protein CJU90_1920 [Yarrowia sp. C11]